MLVRDACGVLPPTIELLQRQGVAGLRVDCRTGYCVHSATLRFDAIGLPPDLPFPAIEASRRLVCSACGGRRVSTMPDWPAHNTAQWPTKGWIMPPGAAPRQDGEASAGPV